MSLLLPFLLSAGLANAETTAERQRQAGQAVARGDYKGAVTLLETGLADPLAQKDDYASGTSMLLLGTAYGRLNEQFKAIQTWSSALKKFERANDKERQRACYIEIAKTYVQLRQFKEAAESYHAAILIDETGELAYKGQDRQSLAWMQEQAGDLHAALKSWETLLKEEDPGNKGALGEYRLNMAAVYKKLGDSRAAAEFLKEGKKLADEAGRKATEEHADGAVDQLYFAAQGRARAGDTEGAYKGFEKMLAEARKRKFKNGMVIALLQLGAYDSNAGKHEDSIKRLDEAARLAHEGGMKQNETAALTYLGVEYVNIGESAKGLAALERARALSGNELQVLHGLRLVYSVLGDFPKIVDTNAQILEAARRNRGKRALLQAETDIGRFYDEIGDDQTGAEYHSRALELAKQLGDRQEIAGQLNEYGCVLLAADEYDAAIDTFRQSLSMQDWPGGHGNVAEALLYKGELEKAAVELRPMGADHILMGYYYLAKGDYDRARRTYTSRLSEVTKDVDTVLSSRIGLALAYEGLRDYYKAAYHFKEAEKIIERQRDSLSLDHRLFFLGQGGWMAPYIEAYEGMVRVSEFLPGGARDSLYHAEFTRGRLFAESAARNYSTPDTRLPAELAEKERKFNQAVSTAATRAEAANRTTDQAAFRRLDNELSVSKKERDGFVRGLRRDYPEYAAMRYPEPLRVEEFALEPGEVLLEFEVTKPYTRAFVVKDGRVALSYNVKLTRDELSDLVRKYRAFFENVSGTEQLAAFDPKLGNRLYELLLKPALEAEENGKPLVPADARIIIAPDEILSILPFESLVVSLPGRLQSPSGRYGPAPVGVSYVADKYDIAYAHSATALTVQRRLKHGKAPSRELLVLADPVFNAADLRLRGAALAKTTSSENQVKTMGAIGTAMGLAGKRGGEAQEKKIGRDDFLFPRLDKTGLLAYVLRDKIFSGQPSEVLIGATASKNELLSRDLFDYRYIVIATHGILDNMVPGLREPALVLNQVGNAAGDNGLLTMSEVMRLRLNAEIVALTACQTGMGKHLTGEGVMGLGRAFQYAGARNVLVSLWNVSEGSTTMLAERFFYHLKQGNTARQALRVARQDVRRAGYEHPFYWAPFILIGE